MYTMAKEQTFKSPGFFEREIDLSQRQDEPLGIPYGVVGTADRGPAFVPRTVGSFEDFKAKFGPIRDKFSYGAHAVKHIFRANESSAVAFIRVLGAGANTTTTHFEKTRNTGQVLGAGFVVTSSNTAVGNAYTRDQGCVQFLVADHTLAANEAFGMPMFTDNDSLSATPNLIRAMVLLASGTRMQVLDGDGGEAWTNESADFVTPTADGTFILTLSSSNGSSFGTAEGNNGVLLYTASLDPSSANYVGKILNTNPTQFAAKQHMLYADFAVDNELAAATTSGNSIAVVSGSASTNASSGDTAMIFRDAFGHFDTRYQAARTTWFISQPRAGKESNLFYFELRDDGADATHMYKVSIANIRRSLDVNNEYGTFDVQVRAFDDTDTNTKIVESFPGCTLDPDSDDYIGRKIGDKKVSFKWDADQDDDRRLSIEGRYTNKSSIIRVVVADAVASKDVNEDTLPFGFRGLEVLKTNDAFDDSTSASTVRLGSHLDSLTTCVVPPMPLRFKVTKGNTASSGFAGNTGTNERIDSRLYWGVKTTRTAESAPLNANASAKPNAIVKAYTKMLGLRKLDVLVTGSGADTFNNNKFTLARVALSALTDETNLTGTVASHMKEAAYIRNAKYFTTDNLLDDGIKSNRVSFGTLVNVASGSTFNTYSDYMKFTNVFYGGFDGVNMLDVNDYRLNDEAVSLQGNAESIFVSPGLASSQGGSGVENGLVHSYRTAGRIMTDPMVSSINVLAIPGIREPLVTNNVASNVKDYAMALYVMDIPRLDDDDAYVFDSSTTKPNVENTRIELESRNIDNNYVASYFPDVVVNDSASGNGQRFKMPASVAALSALAFNDKVSYPWFAPAGFNRAALDSVTGVDVRLNAADKDNLYESRINPIASFPRRGFVIFGQKTLQRAKSALDRVNVRRMMIALKRRVVTIARRFVFEQNTQGTRNDFIRQVLPVLSTMKAQSGIEGFKITMDSTNNTQQDIDNNILRGRIEVVPTRAIEFIAIDFIITNAGVEFV